MSLATRIVYAIVIVFLFYCITGSDGDHAPTLEERAGSASVAFLLSTGINRRQDDEEEPRFDLSSILPRKPLIVELVGSALEDRGLYAGDVLIADPEAVGGPLDIVIEDGPAGFRAFRPPSRLRLAERTRPISVAGVVRYFLRRV